MIRKLIRYAALAGLVGIGACEDALTVENPNSGNKDKVLGTPNDAENLIGSYYKRWHVGVYGGGVEGRLNIWTFLNFSSLANNCQNTSYPFSSNNISNVPGNPCGGEHFSNYNTLAEVQRVASDFIGKLDATGPTSSTSVRLRETPARERLPRCCAACRSASSRCCTIRPPSFTRVRTRRTRAIWLDTSWSWTPPTRRSAARS
jgi:hypothetical protein